MISSGNTVLMDDTFDFHPATSYEKTLTLPAGIKPEDLNVTVKTAEGCCLVSWQAELQTKRPLPKPAEAAKKPTEIVNNEQLYLTGLHLEQYRHATYNPRTYYEKALTRNPGDSRCNNALGLWYLRRGQFAKAEPFFRKAIETLTERNPNPIDGEAFFNLGITLRYLNKNDEAYQSFYKSVWNAAWMDNGYFQLARLETMNRQWEAALDTINRSLIRNGHNHKARQLKTSILRYLGRENQALVLVEESLLLDRFNFSLYYEKYLLTGNDAILNEMKLLIRANIHNYIEYALDYAWAGLYEEAVRYLSLGMNEQAGQKGYPLAYYFKAWFQWKLGKADVSRETLSEALNQCPDCCFPNQPEAVVALQWTTEINPKDYKALYYLGNFWYACNNYNEAVICWEKSTAIFPGFPTTHRNLSLAYFNKQNKPEQALASLKKAFELDPSDARILMELDQLCKRLNHPLTSRLERLEKFRTVVDQRDDLYLELATLYNLTGACHAACKLLMNRKFHPWEGGEGKVTGQYVFCMTAMGKQAIREKAFSKAVEYLTRARTYPVNLGEGKLSGAQENELLYLLGIAYERMNEPEKAKASFREASLGIKEVSAAMFYNDQQPDTIFYQGLALQKLGKGKAARKRFDMLIRFGKTHRNDQVKIDYFAVSLPDLLIWEDDLNARNRELCRYLTGLGQLGKGNAKTAIRLFNQIIKENPSHQGAITFIKERVTE
ncbi:MAG: tetratricopeptide repeat protein [Mangrovibacterium sp.]